MASAQQKCDSQESNTTETLKEDITVVLLRPILCGVYSFLHWFILVPLLWTAFAHGNWNATSFLVYEVVAFAIWLAVIVLILNMKCCMEKESPRSQLKTGSDSSSHLAPHFQTRTSHVQPKDKNLFHEAHSSQSGCNNGDKQVSISLYSIPVQPQCVPFTSSKKNTEKSADLYSASVPDLPDQKSQSVILPIKENTKPNSRHNSPLLTECADENLEWKDNVYHCEDNAATSLKDTVMPDSKQPHLSREESFVGLPEMNSFDSYLQLVTVETPSSPREPFFPDSVKKLDSDRAKQLNQSKEVNSLESKIVQTDPPAMEEGDIRSKMKDNPDEQCGSGSGGNISSSGGSSSSKSGNGEKLPKGDDGDDDVFTLGTPAPHSKPKESLGECFIAEVRKTESLTSEVFITVNEPSRHRIASGIINVHLPSDALHHGSMNETDMHEEGKWAILK